MHRALQRWSTGRRAAAPASLIALMMATATFALVASASNAPHVAAAPSKPDDLVPIGTLLRDGSLPAPALTGDNGTVGVPANAPRPPTTPNPAQTSRQAPLIAGYAGAPGTLTPAGIATLALEHGCAPGPAVIATAIAMAESGGSPSAQGDIGLMNAVWDWSAGLWQIRGLRSERGTGGLRDSVANQAVDKNAAAMIIVSQHCTDWTPWSTYNNGAYQQFLTLAQGAVQYVIGYYNAHHHYPPVPAPDPNATIPESSGGGGAAPRPATSGSSQRSAAASQHSSSPTGHAQPGAPTQPAPAPAQSSTATPAPVHLPATPKPVPTSPLPLPLPTTLLPTPTPSPPLPGPSLP